MHVGIATYMNWSTAHTPSKSPVVPLIIPSIHNSSKRVKKLLNGVIKLAISYSFLFVCLQKVRSDILNKITLGAKITRSIRSSNYQPKNLISS